jgi:hypothetical protein
LAQIGAGIELAFAVLVASVRAAGSTVGQRRSEGPLPTIAFGVVLAAPGCWLSSESGRSVR